MSHLRNAWTVAAGAHELPAGTLPARTLPDEPLVLSRDAAAVRARRLLATLLEKERAA